MATEAEYYSAIAAVTGGTAGPNQLHLVRKAAQQAGQMGRDARAALESAGDTNKR